MADVWEQERDLYIKYRARLQNVRVVLQRIKKPNSPFVNEDANETSVIPTEECDFKSV